MKNILLLLSFFLSPSISGSNMDLKIIPTPQIVNFTNRSVFKIDENTELIIEKDNNPKKTVKYLKKGILDLFDFTPNISFSQEGNKYISLEIVDRSFFPENIPQENIDQSYTLIISEKSVSIKSPTERGLFYGSVSLLQILEHNNGFVNSCEITDWPDLKFRGISDDISRGQVSNSENFKRIIRFLARYKMNVYMPYLEDMIEFQSFPTIGKNRGALSKKEIIELVSYASDYYVEIIPIFQTLGHYENILSQKEFIQYADWPGAASLDVTSEDTYTFLETLMKEVFDLFPSEYFHIGADESYDIGFGKSKKLVQETSLAKVHSDHYKRVYDICKAYDKKVMMYGDIILENLEILDDLPEDIIIVDWQYKPKFDYPSCRLFKESGFDFIVSPSVWNFNAIFPENFFAYPNILSFTEAGIENHSLGMINSSWGDYGAETFRELNLQGYAWSAQCAWNIDDSKISVFNHSFFTDFYGISNEKIKAVINDLSNPVNQILWNEFWRHPLMPPRKADWRSNKLPLLSKFLWMKNYTSREELADFKKTACKNLPHLELLEFNYDIREYYILKLETQMLLYNKMNGLDIDDKELIVKIDKNIKSLNDLRKRFAEFWQKYNKAANLWMIEEKFERLKSYFLDIRNQVIKGEELTAYLKSDFIYYPSTEANITDYAEFKYKFNVASEVEEGKLQFLADGHAKLYINDQYIDEVFVKRSGSLWLEQQRVKLIDISDFIEKGENEILLKVKNYKNRNAGCNVIAYIFTASDTLEILSNEEWMVRNKMEPDWVNAFISKDYKKEITPPDFLTGRKSWIER